MRRKLCCVIIATASLFWATTSYVGELAFELCVQILRTYDDIVDYCCYAWNTLIDQPWKIMSIARRDWAVAGQSL